MKKPQPPLGRRPATGKAPTASTSLQDTRRPETAGAVSRPLLASMLATRQTTVGRGQEPNAARRRHVRGHAAPQLGPCSVLVHFGTCGQAPWRGRIPPPPARGTGKQEQSLSARRGCKASNSPGCRYNCRTMEMRPRNDDAAAVQPGAKVVRIGHPNEQLWVVQQLHESIGQAFIKNERGGTFTTHIDLLKVMEVAPPNFKRAAAVGGGRSDGREGAPAPRRPATARAAPARPRKTTAEVARVLAAPTPYLVLGVRPNIELR